MAGSADLIIIGGGIVGLASAYQISLANPSLRLILIEKENAVARHQTGRNSGVIHSGIYYKPGSYKARNCIEGREALVKFAREFEVKHDVCGKVIVATQEDELERLERIYNTGIQNGLTENRFIDPNELKEIEPNCFGIKAIWVPYTGIIDFVGVCERLQSLLIEQGHQIVLSEKVKAITNESGGEYAVRTDKNVYRSRFLIGCAGLQADRIAEMEGLKPTVKIVGFRGDYYDLTPQATHKVRNLIYPVPDPAFPFLGVHFTRMARGGVECGPNAVFSFKREGYSPTAFDLRDAADALGFSGTWRLFARHWRRGADEYRRAFSKTAFLKQLQRLIPSLTMADIVAARSGVRAQALKPDGSLVDDFDFLETERSIHVLNAPSPAATACLAIGAEVNRRFERLKNGLSTS